MRFKAVAIFIIAATPAAAQIDETGLNLCRVMDEDLDRLACYDRVSGRTPKLTARPSKGPWLVTDETSKMTDEKNVFLSVLSDEEVDCGWNDNDKIRLTIRCMENTTAMVFATGCHMASSDYDRYGDVTYRLDDDDARTVSAQASSNSRALGLWSGGRSIPVIKGMFGKQKMIVRMMPYGESAFTAEFNIAGLEEAIEPLREACHW